MGKKRVSRRDWQEGQERVVKLTCPSCGKVLDGIAKPWLVDHAMAKCRCGTPWEKTYGTGEL